MQETKPDIKRQSPSPGVKTENDDAPVRTGRSAIKEKALRETDDKPRVGIGAAPKRRHDDDDHFSRSRRSQAEPQKTHKSRRGEDNDQSAPRASARKDRDKAADKAAAARVGRVGGVTSAPKPSTTSSCYARSQAKPKRLHKPSGRPVRTDEMKQAEAEKREEEAKKVLAELEAEVQPGKRRTRSTVIRDA